MLLCSLNDVKLVWLDISAILQCFMFLTVKIVLIIVYASESSQISNVSLELQSRG